MWPSADRPRSSRCRTRIWPAGGYAAAPTLTVQAGFGFVAKYQQAATILTGRTDFQCHVAHFSFVSTNYHWLVVAGLKVQFQRIGRLIGQGNDTVLLMANDDQAGRSSRVDRCRIKIWDTATDAVVHDNQPGADDTATAAAAIGSDIIIIQHFTSRYRLVPWQPGQTAVGNLPCHSFLSAGVGSSRVGEDTVCSPWTPSLARIASCLTALTIGEWV